MRKLLSILLLAVVGLPLLSPLLAFGADGRDDVPACCRRNGQHHCQSMSMGESRPAAGHTAHWTTSPAKCPFAPATVAGTHPDLGTAPTIDELSATLLSHPCGIAQTEARWRVVRDRSHGKRGPPSLLS